MAPLRATGVRTRHKCPPRKSASEHAVVWRTLPWAYRRVSRRRRALFAGWARTWPLALDRRKNAAAIDDYGLFVHHADDHTFGVWDTHQQHATCLSKIKFFQPAQVRRTHPS